MRNSKLTRKRDRRMVEMFYQLYDVKRKRMDDVLTELSEDHFYLDKQYIYNKIFYDNDNLKYYNEMLKYSGKIQPMEGQKVTTGDLLSPAYE